MKSWKNKGPRPIFLLADSQLLFWRDQGGLFLERLTHSLEEALQGRHRAAYVGASNGDQPQFYEIFVAAMAGIHVRDCRMIPSAPAQDDLEYLDVADLILLAGGDTQKGWDVFQANGLDKKIVECYYDGAILIGVSAGAIQLGLQGWYGPAAAPEGVFSTFQLAPYVIDVHDEPEWRRLGQTILKLGGHGRGFGIPSGGGAILYPDWSVEPVRRPLVEFTTHDDGLRRALLFPPDTTAVDSDDASAE